jgi:hypothetical protein
MLPATDTIVTALLLMLFAASALVEILYLLF